jgi:ferrous iron transport protein A
MQALNPQVLPTQNAISVGPISLTDCHKGQQVVLTELCAHSAFGVQDAGVTERMKALGFLPGVRLTLIGYGLFGKDPIAVQINGTKFALRRAEAQKIRVIPV